MGSLERIWIKRARRGPMDAVERAQVRAGRGLAGNANQGGKRQVTLLAREQWEPAVADIGAPGLDPKARRANLLLTGVDLTNSRGRILRIGQARIRIAGETRPCEQMEEARAGLQEALSPAWTGGAFGEVLDDAEIQVGDEVTWENEALRH